MSYLKYCFSTPHEGRKVASFLETILKTPKQNRTAELYKTVAVESVR